MDRPSHWPVLRYMYGLVVTVILTSGLLLGVVLYRYETQRSEDAHLGGYHLTSLAVNTELTDRLSLAQDVVGSEGRLTSALSVESELVGIAFSLRRLSDSLVELQASDGDPEFEGAVNRIASRAMRIDRAASEGLWSRETYVAELAAFEFGVFQLSRLHGIAADRELEQASSRNDLVRLIAVSGVPALLLVSALVVARMIKLVRQRLAELDSANAELFDARVRLEQTRRLDSLGTLVGGIAHDFNNLLTVILAYTDVSRRRVGADHPAYTPMTNVLAAGERAAGLTRQLLAFSRQETTQLEPTDLNVAIRDLEPVLRSLVPDNIELEIECDADLAPVVVDATQMDQVMMNLVVNARDAMAEGGRLQISTKAIDFASDHGNIPAGSYGRMRVEDTGVGMSAEDRDRAFEPFFTTKPLGQGTGLGLSTVHGLVTANGGYVTVDSELGRGSLFDVFIPQTSDPLSDPGSDSTRGSGRSAETILLVEDEEQIRDLLCGALRDDGYEVIEASDAQEALDRGQRSGVLVDVVVTDVVMPGKSGTELVAALRESNPEIGVVYMSGYSDQSVLRQVQESGETFVPKPFKINEMLRAVQEAVEVRAHHRQASDGKPRPTSSR